MSALRISVSLTLLVAPLAMACGSGLTNSEWLAEPESGAVAADASTTLQSNDSVAYPTSDSAPRSGPQRLDHTVTLGEVVATPRDATASAAAAPPPAPITITINSYGAPATYGYPAVLTTSAASSRTSAASASTSRGSSSTAITPGQSWPAPASAGPSFPFSTSPASPWETHR